jgi:hypothetical protein
VFTDETILTVRVLAALVAIAALIAAAAGIVDPSLYKPIIADRAAPFIYGQDVISLLAAIALLLTISAKGIKIQIFQAGIVGYLFYAYAPYVMGTLYTYAYFLYMAVLGLSIFYFINAFSGIVYERLELTISRSLRIALAICCAAIVVYFAPQWIVAIWKNIQTNTWSGNSGFHDLYYVYILDMCFVLPVCAVTAVLLLRKGNLGLVLGGVVPVFGGALMASVAAGFLCQPLFGQEMSLGDVAQFSIITLLFLILSAFYFRRTQAQFSRI